MSENGNIAYQNKDITAKYLEEHFASKSFSVYGIVKTEYEPGKYYAPEQDDRDLYSRYQAGTDTSKTGCRLPAVSSGRGISDEA